MRKQRVRGIIGILLIVISIGGIVIWEKGGREALTYEDVLVLREAAEPGTVIEASMLGTIKMEKDLLIEDRVTDYQTIVGLTAKSYIPAKLQLSQRFFEPEGMTIGEGNYVCAIPREWLCAYPQSLRRGDTVYFYEVDAGDTAGLTRADKPVTNVKVAYVKDSTNREVVDITADRLDGSAESAQIEVILNDEQFAALCGSVELGRQFVLAYE